MRAIILAAGRGTRLRPLTNDKPKCFVKLDGKRLIDWQLSALMGAGIEHIAIVRGYMAHKYKIKGVRYFDNPNWERSDTVGSLLCAAEWLRAGTTIISYSDIAYCSETIKTLISSPGDIVVANNTEWLHLWKARFDDPLKDAESFRMTTGGKLIEIGNKAESIAEVQGQYMGLTKVTPKAWFFFEKIIGELDQLEINSLDTLSLLTVLIERGFTINTVPIAGMWFEIDSINDLKVSQAIINEQRENICFFTQEK